MKRTLQLGILLAICASAFSAAAQRPMFAQPGELPTIDRATRAAVIDSITAEIDTVYVIKETADRIIAHLREQQAAGAYRDLTDPVEFVRRLDQDARSVYDDNHFGLAVLYPLDPNAEEQLEDPRESAAFKRMMRARNYGFRKVEILPGNVGYLKLDQFPHTTQAADVANAAMNFFANADALIIDLRDNGGGAAAMIRLIASYLFEGRQHLINWYERAPDLTVQSWTLDYVPGKRLPEVPVFVLTSGRTGSAAEEFTFDMQHLGRATIVGETTNGGGHTVAQAFYTFDGFRVGMRLPYGRAYDPKTGKGWEGTGVSPDLDVPEADALLTAQIAALDSLAARAEDDVVRAELAWAREDLEGQLHPRSLARKDMDQYVGTYGPRRVFVDNEALFYQREERPQMQLLPLGEDRFRVGDLDYFRIQFDRDEDGRIHRLTGIYNTGRTDGNDRSS